MEANKIIKSTYEGHFPGRDGKMFTIQFEKQIYQVGDIVTWDYRDGQNLMIREVTSTEVNVVLITNDKNSWVPMYKLESGVEYYKIG